MSRVGWLDFQPEPEMTGDGSGDPDTHYLTIADGLGTDSWPEEIAVICHRTVDGKYPLNGHLANVKRANAQVICDALNANGREYASQLWQDDRESAVCRHCHRRILKDPIDGWICPEATGDDIIWRETCENHDTFIAEHEPGGDA